MITTSLLLTRQESAERLSQSVRTIDKLIESGDLAVVRIGRSIRIRPSALEYFIEARETRVKIKVKRIKTAVAGTNREARQ